MLARKRLLLQSFYHPPLPSPLISSPPLPPSSLSPIYVWPAFCFKLGEWSTFQAAGIEQKRDIFNPPEVEVRKMLDENLLKSFLISKVFLNACKRVQEEEDAGMKLEDVSYEGVIHTRVAAIDSEILT